MSQSSHSNSRPGSLASPQASHTVHSRQRQPLVRTTRVIWKPRQDNQITKETSANPHVCWEQEDALKPSSPPSAATMWPKAVITDVTVSS